MIVGIEETTDNRHPETSLKKFRSESSAIRWLTEPDANGYAWSGAADETLPSTQQNWHRRLRAAWEIEPGYQPSAKAVQNIVTSWRHTSRHVTTETAKAQLYRQHAVRKIVPPRKEKS